MLRCSSAFHKDSDSGLKETMVDAGLSASLKSFYVSYVNISRIWICFGYTVLARGSVVLEAFF